MHPSFDPHTQHLVDDFHRRLAAITAEHAHALTTLPTEAIGRDVGPCPPLRRLPHQVFRWAVSRFGHRLTQQQEQDSAPDPEAAPPVFIIDPPYRVVSTKPPPHLPQEDK